MTTTRPTLESRTLRDGIPFCQRHEDPHDDLSVTVRGFHTRTDNTMVIEAKINDGEFERLTKAELQYLFVCETRFNQTPAVTYLSMIK